MYQLQLANDTKFLDDHQIECPRTYVAVCVETRPTRFERTTYGSRHWISLEEHKLSPAVESTSESG